MTPKERAAKEKAIEAAGEGVWVWQTEQAMPALVIEADRTCR